MLRVVVDLNRCESYAQCVFAAPAVFWMKDEESLEYDYAPDYSLRVQVERAAAACPVQAISICWLDDQLEQQGGNHSEQK
ncbi:ferredoxin [Methanosarcina sp. T3]|uniref:ferredoxin n=1 Tax=Methanosarcina sp. T3 TaxID=3439062 RepID=UPI003F843C8F